MYNINKQNSPLIGMEQIS